MAHVVTDANFAETLNTDKLVVVDFWATWCGPCKAIAPIVDELATEYDGKAVICKCNVDECDDVPMNYNIRSIPTLLFFKNGEVVEDECVDYTEHWIGEFDTLEEYNEEYETNLTEDMVDDGGEYIIQGGFGDEYGVWHI